MAEPEATGLSKDRLLELYRQLTTIREFEERINVEVNADANHWTLSTCRAPCVNRVALQRRHAGVASLCHQRPQRHLDQTNRQPGQKSVCSGIPGAVT